MRIVIRTDTNGLYIEDVLISQDAEIPANCIDTPCPQGFFHPRWNGETWVEGMPQEEITALKSKIQPPTIEQRLEAAESVLMDIIMMM